MSKSLYRVTSWIKVELWKLLLILAFPLIEPFSNTFTVALENLPTSSLNLKTLWLQVSLKSLITTGTAPASFNTSLQFILS